MSGALDTRSEALSAQRSIAEISAQSQQLADLVTVHAVRLAAAERELAATRAEGAELDELLDLLKKDLARVDEQRRLWTQRWQAWLEDGGAVQHGRGFTQRHAEFTELERVLLQHQGEIGEQRDAVQTRIDAARSERNRLVRQRDALLEKRKALQRALTARRESLQDEQSSEQLLARWHARRVDLEAWQADEVLQ